jgi:hypothetical protein
MADKFCIYCGKPLTGAKRFCTKCGKPVGDEMEPKEQSSESAGQFFERLANQDRMTVSTQPQSQPAAQSETAGQFFEHLANQDQMPTSTQPQSQPAARPQSGVSGAPDSGQVLYDRVPEPKQNAFTVLVPRGWKIRGGMFYVNPLQVNGPGNALLPKCDFAVMNDDLGTIMLRWMPSWNHADLTYSPNQGASFPPGQWYQGMPVRPIISARQFLWEMLQAERPGASGMTIAAEDPLNDVTALFHKNNEHINRNLQQMGLGTMKFESWDMRVEYTEQGRRFWEEVTVTICDNRQSAFTWTNDNTFMLRAPTESFIKWGAVLALIRNSLQTNPQWLAAIEQARGQHAKIALETQQYINQVAAKVLANRQKAYEEAQQQREEEPPPPEEGGKESKEW